jgi:hypothetical protein
MVSVRYFVAASRARASESRSERFGTRVEDFFLACARPAGESRRARAHEARYADGFSPRPAPGVALPFGPLGAARGDAAEKM